MVQVSASKVEVVIALVVKLGTHTYLVTVEGLSQGATVQGAGGGGRGGGGLGLGLGGGGAGRGGGGLGLGLGGGRGGGGLGLGGGGGGGELHTPRRPTPDTRFVATGTPLLPQQ